MPLFTFARCLLLASCALAATPPRPDWVDGRSSKYPGSAYLIGVGEGPGREQAADKARAEISKVFGVDLTARTQVFASAATDGSGSSESQSVSDDVRSSTRKFLEGVEVSEYWQDAQGGVHALAVLDRAHALAMVSDKIAETDRIFKESSADLAKAEGKFSALRAALKVQRAARLRRQLNNDHRILSPDGTGLPAPETAHDDLSRAVRAVSAVKVEVTAAGDESAAVAARVLEGLREHGLQSVEEAASADVLIEVLAEGRRMPIENLTWFTAEGKLTVTMSYARTGEVFKRFEESGQSSSGSPRTSVRVALTRLAGKAANSAYQVLNSPWALDD